jgi:penicillin amidase
MLKKLSWSFGILFIVLILFIAGGYYYLILMPQPAVEGELKVEGFQKDVRVLRDQWGVPHIYAQNEHDLFMAQGFIQAQDRLWQMETNRRIGSGRLS